MTVATVGDATAAGRRKVAVALVALGPARAAVLLRGMAEDEVTAIAGEIAQLGPVTPAEVRSTLAELGQGLRNVSTLPAPGKQFAKDLLVQALGQERGALASGALDRPEPFSWLADAEPEAAAGILDSEPAGAVALAFAHLEPRTAAGLLVRMPEERRSAIATRMAALAAVHPDTLAEVEAALRSRFDDVRTVAVLPLAGPTLLAQMLAKAGKETATALLGALAEVSQELADEVRAALFTFDDLCAIEPRQMQLLMREVDMRQLSVAIATATSAVQGLFAGALSERARETLMEEVDLARNRKAAEVTEARAGLVATARRMEDEGTLVLRSDEDEV